MKTRCPALAAALAGTAFGTNAAGTRAYYLVAAAMRAKQIHKHISEGFLHTVSMGLPVAPNMRSTFIRRVIGDHID